MSGIIIAVFTGWAVLHSLLAGKTVKRKARALFGASTDRWYRFGFVVFAVLTLAPIVVLLLLLPDRTLYAVPSPWRWIMNVGQAVSAVLLAWTIRQTRPMRFIGLTRLLDPEDGGAQKESKLAEGGLYGMVRHPMYFFALLLMWLSPSMTVNRLALYALITLYFFVGSIHEETLLIDEFGDVYRTYRRRVPRLIPGLKRRSRGG